MVVSRVQGRIEPAALLQHIAQAKRTEPFALGIRVQPWAIGTVINITGKIKRQDRELLAEWGERETARMQAELEAECAEAQVANKARAGWSPAYHLDQAYLFGLPVLSVLSAPQCIR